MYNGRRKLERSGFTGVVAYEAESLEIKIQRIMANKEPITDGAPLIYTDRKNGVQPSYNIRTDRWDVAVEAMDKVSKSYIAQREERAKVIEMKKGDVGGAKSVEGTDGNP